MQFLIRFFGSGKNEAQLTLIRFIISRFGYRPKKISYFEQAITHKSNANSKYIDSNERLEFLGDAIIDAVVAEFLFARFPNEDEGYLTKIKSKLVSRKTLSEIAEEMEIRQVLRYHKGRSININTLEGNAFEAIIGAIYLDGGFEQVRQTLEQHVYRKYVNINKVLEEEIDFKSKLFIWSQRNKLSIDFEIISEVNKGSSWEYKVIVLINEQKYGLGTGSSKKAAEQVAAKETLELIGVI
ncbi:ribonuclease III [Crocinitomicaceae bacterium CZZ-1]|uniref:Ribonuclease 3 n=1 Tax=Taishania pollutisoli TaxID=2766479 RepID=A0A8J6PIY7_9FLAO|nr:ribonuclease III [Taishania pollutisoli]MBC9812479.1 ribonuclease III [Taishania pollutisoli]MBX2949372.1 ribonuclease III [Crocinitomicaceae bacterium]NGF74451.1 ribonuclease III [Fluviicola sp. SGL-29]